jgi:hypothetical protein
MARTMTVPNMILYNATDDRLKGGDTNTVGIEVGLVGRGDGDVDGIAVGFDVGRLVGTRVGRLDVGITVGTFVSPGLVGLEVTGAVLGDDDGELVVGVDVGALISTFSPITTVDSLNDLIYAFAFGAKNAGTSPSIAARISAIEKSPLETALDTDSAIDLVKSSGVEVSGDCPSTLLVIANVKEDIGTAGFTVGLKLGLFVGDRMVGIAVGVFEGLKVGPFCLKDGARVVGNFVGTLVGDKDGFVVAIDGLVVEAIVGDDVFVIIVGDAVGADEVACVRTTISVAAVPD